MTMLLTDDEAVAVAAQLSNEFPAWLPTVARSPGEAMAAVLRGTRSLTVRGLAWETDGAMTVDSRVMDLLRPFTEPGWTYRCLAYSAKPSFPVPVGGVRVFATDQAGTWRLDEISRFGVHTIRLATEDEYLTHIRDFADPGGEMYRINGEQVQAHAIAYSSWGLSDEIVLKSAEGFGLARRSDQRGDAELTPGPDIAVEQIDRAQACERLGVAAG